MKRLYLNNTLRALTMALATGMLLLLVFCVTLSHAAEQCRVQIDPKTGTLEVSARRVGLHPRWSTEPNGASRPFTDEGQCFDAEKGELKKCHLGAPGTLAAITPPPSCSLCVSDSGLGSCCVSHIKGCTPGVRVGDASLSASDPRLSIPLDRIRLTNCEFPDCLDTPTQFECSAGKVLRSIAFPELDDAGNEQANGCSSNAGSDNVSFTCCEVSLY